MTNNNVFKIESKPDYVYHQYRVDSVIQKFFEIIDDLIKEWYYDETLELMWLQRDIRDSNNNFLYFYSRYYLGFIRPVKLNPQDLSTEVPFENVIGNYDSAMEYDGRFIWDNYADMDPELPISMFITMLGYIYDYSYETWTHDLMARYAADMCNISPNDIQISFEPTKVIYWLPVQHSCQSFITYTKQDEYKMNFPFADCYEFRLGDVSINTNAIDEFMLGYMRPDTWPSIMP